MIGIHLHCAKTRPVGGAKARRPAGFRNIRHQNVVKLAQGLTRCIALNRFMDV